MKPRLVFIALVSASLLMIAAAPMWIAWAGYSQLPDTPESKSAFSKNYTPADVIKPYLCKQSFSSGNGSGEGADNKSVNHTADFFWNFSMQSDEQSVLMDSLDRDLSAQLTGNGVQILSRSGDAVKGFRYSYTLHNAFGTVTILPIAPAHVQRARRLPAGVVDVVVSVQLAETWLPKETPAIEASLKLPQ